MEKLPDPWYNAKYSALFDKINEIVDWINRYDEGKKSVGAKDWDARPLGGYNLED